MNGWISIHRKIIDWEWFTDINTTHLFLYLLLTANHEDGNWQGIPIKRGQLITGLYSLSKNTGLSVQNIRTSLAKLKKTQELTIKATNKFSVISIIKYNDYQQIDTKLTSKLTNHQQTTNKQLTTNNNINNKIKDSKAAKAAPKPLYHKLQNFETKISAKLVNALKELSPTGELDGDYKMDNLFPAKEVAKKIIKFTGKELDIDNPEHHEEIIAQFKGLISRLDSFDRNKATKMSYIKYNFNSLAAKASSKTK